jgi:hypothetical protein
MTALGAWFLGGLYLDGWAHNHGRVDDSFFTPWHAVFYAGFGAVALVALTSLAHGLLRGRTWHLALPAGYEPLLVGVPLFALGGVGDMVWHTLFGIEEDVEALISPTHLTLAVAMALILSGPLRAAWRRPPAQGWIHLGPAVLSLVFLVALMGFMTQFAHPFVHVMARSSRYSDAGDALGVTAVLLQTALLMGPLLLALRRGTLPVGSLTLTLTLTTALIALMEDRYLLIPAAFAAGLAGDLLLAVLRPSPARPLALRVFATTVPALLYLLYFLTVHLTGGMLWSIHLWLGATFLAGVSGLLLSLLVEPSS